MQALAPLSTGYLPWNPAALRPAALVTALNEVVVNERRQIVELGGGVSTFYLCRLLAHSNESRVGHLHTVEHDGDWAEWLERKLEAEGLDEVSTVIHAPLVSNGWYDADKLRYLRDIDLLLVDGPPAFAEGLEHARYPAIPFFIKALAPNWTIILDDIDRRGEQEILQQWEAELGVRFERRLTRGSIAIGRSNPSYTL